jgi:hypothetical protein
MYKICLKKLINFNLFKIFLIIMEIKKIFIFKMIINDFTTYQIIINYVYFITTYYFNFIFIFKLQINRILTIFVTIYFNKNEKYKVKLTNFYF